MALVDGPGYCDKHKAEASGWSRRDDKPGSTTARGYGHAWARLRESILRRDNGLCQECLRNGRVALATHVDHIIPKSRGGSDDPGNLQSLCVACHKSKTAHEGRGGAKV